MEPKIRIATFNLENLDDLPEEHYTLDERIALMRPQMERLKADILCLQEVNGQEELNHPRRLLALQKLLKGTIYENYNMCNTTVENGSEVYDERNLVILSHFDILESHQYKCNFIKAPQYQKVTAIPPENQAKTVEWERPMLYAKIRLPNSEILHVINLHLKSKIPTNIPGQKKDYYTWKTASGWAEGYFLSSMKRVGQALEARVFIDKIMNENRNPYILVCGDFNAESDDVPVMAIRGDVENTGNKDLANRVLVPCENSIPASSRYTLLHHGKGEMIDHLLVTRNFLKYLVGSEIHNEILHDESIAFATDKYYPESDHAPIVTEFVME